MNDRNHCVRYIRIDKLLCRRDLRWGNLRWKCLCWTILRWRHSRWTILRWRHSRWTIGSHYVGLFTGRCSHYVMGCLPVAAPITLWGCLPVDVPITPGAFPYAPITLGLFPPLLRKYIYNTSPFIMISLVLPLQNMKKRGYVY